MRRVFAILALLVAFHVHGLGQSTKSGETAPQPAESQTKESRSELWRTLKIKKSNNLQPYRIGPMERVFLHLESGLMGNENGTRFTGLFPLIGTVTSGSGPSLGLEYRREHEGWMPVDMAVSGEYSTKGYQGYELQLGNLLERETTFTVDPIGERLITEFTRKKRTERGLTYYADIHLKHLPQEVFFGLGRDSTRENETNYRLLSASYEGVAGFQLTDWLGASVRAGLVQFDLGPGTSEDVLDIRARYNEATAPGIIAQPNFVRVAAGVILDSRDIPMAAHSGSMLGLLFSHYDDRHGDLSEFNRVAFDVRHYIPLASRYRTLALRVVASSDRVPRGDFVPFYLLESLGGINGVRGFEDFRFRDRNLLLGSAEYRWDPAEFLQMVAFYDSGKVFSRTSEFGFSGLEKGFGGGVRLKIARGVLLRVELAHSREGNILHLKLGPAF